VFYSPRRNRQTQFLSSTNNKPLSAVVFSRDGSLVAAGESGRQPSILVWDAATGVLVSELKGHVLSIRALAFSSNQRCARAPSRDPQRAPRWPRAEPPRSSAPRAAPPADAARARARRFLASAGGKGDGKLHVWDWKAGQVAWSARVAAEVRSLGFSEDSSLLVSAGAQGHLRHWEIDPAGTKGEVRQLKGRKASMEGGPPSTFELAEVALSRLGPAARESYALTADGFLLMFDAQRVLDKWVDLKTPAAAGLCATERFVACACAAGVVRLFHPATLQYLATLPKPPPFRAPPPAGDATPAPASAARGKEKAALVFPDAVAVRLSPDSQRAAVVYADRALAVWDVRDTARVERCRTVPAHAAGVWDLEFLPPAAAAAAGFPPDSFVTCSSDASLRVWALPPRNPPRAPHGADGAAARPPPFKDLRALVALDPATTAPPAPGGGAPQDGGAPGAGLRCLRVSPDGTRVACGDRAGNLRIHALSPALEELSFLEAHDAEVPCAPHARLLRPPRPPPCPTVPLRDATLLRGRRHQWLQGIVDVCRPCRAPFCSLTRPGRAPPQVLCVDFSPDGRVVASASRDRLIHLFDCEDRCRPALSSIRSEKSLKDTLGSSEKSLTDTL